MTVFEPVVLLEEPVVLEEPAVLRFFMGRLDAVSDWPEKLVAKFKEDFGDSL